MATKTPKTLKQEIKWLDEYTVELKTHIEEPFLDQETGKPAEGCSVIKIVTELKTLKELEADAIFNKGAYLQVKANIQRAKKTIENASIERTEEQKRENAEKLALLDEHGIKLTRRQQILNHDLDVIRKYNNLLGAKGPVQSLKQAEQQLKECEESMAFVKDIVLARKEAFPDAEMSAEKEALFGLK